MSPLPTYPDSAFSANLFVFPLAWIYAGWGIYDGAGHQGIPTGRHGPATLFGAPSDLFLVSELGATWAEGDGALRGRLGLGGWRHTGRFDRFTGGRKSGTSGAYLVLDQFLWHEPGESMGDEAEGLAAFVQLGVADRDVSEVRLHAGAGLSYLGAIPHRDADLIGLGWTRVEFSDRANAGFTENSEVAYELFYRAQLTPWCQLQPDVQFIRDPGGDRALDDVVVGTLRLELTF